MNRPLKCVAVIVAAVAASAVSASAFAQSSVGQDQIPTSKLIVATSVALNAAGHDEASLRRSSAGRERARFNATGAPFSLQDGGSQTDVVRRAFTPGASGPVAMLIMIPGVTVAVEGDIAPTTPDTYYALATAVATRIRVWAFFKNMPDDTLLQPRMIAAIAKFSRPIIEFDPSYVATGAPATWGLK